MVMTSLTGTEGRPASFPTVRKEMCSLKVLRAATWSDSRTARLDPCLVVPRAAVPKEAF